MTLRGLAGHSGCQDRSEASANRGAGGSLEGVKGNGPQVSEGTGPHGFRPPELGEGMFCFKLPCPRWCFGHGCAGRPSTKVLVLMCAADVPSK